MTSRRRSSASAPLRTASICSAASRPDAMAAATEPLSATASPQANIISLFVLKESSILTLPPGYVSTLAILPTLHFLPTAKITVSQKRLNSLPFICCMRSLPFSSSRYSTLVNSTAFTLPSSCIICFGLTRVLKSTPSFCSDSRLYSDICRSSGSSAAAHTTVLSILLSTLAAPAASSPPPITVILSPSSIPSSSPPFICLISLTPSYTISASAPGISTAVPSEAPTAIRQAAKPSFQMSSMV